MTTTPDFEKEMKLLLQSNENQLLEQVGIRVRAIERDLAVAGAINPTITATEVKQMGILSDLKALGSRILARWNRAAFELVCGKGKEDAQTREKLGRALGVGPVAAGAALTSALIGIGLSPALAPLIAAIVISKFFNSAHDEFCSAWEEKLKK